MIEPERNREPDGPVPPGGPTRPAGLLRLGVSLLLAAVPCLAAAAATAATIEEDFATDPMLRGWRAVGETNLFKWDASAQALAVTWDSAKANSFYYHSLGMVLTKSDDVQVSFDLRLADIKVGTNPARRFTFELAVGLLNLAEATSTNFWRGTAHQSPDLLEFDYFADSGFGATISPTIVSSNNQFMPSFTFPLELTAGDAFHITMSYAAQNQTLSTTLEKDGEPIGPIKSVQLGPGFSDYDVDAVAIESYCDTGADGSLLAHGWIDEVKVVLPDPPVTTVQAARQRDTFQVQFLSQTNWTYILERTTDWRQWQPASPATPGNGAALLLQEPAAIATQAHAFYRIRAQRP